MAATKRDYYEAGVSGGGVYEGQSLCVNFLTTESYSAEYVILRAKRLGAFTSVTAYLYSVDGSHKPSTVLATSQTIPGEEISTDVGPVTFTFDTPYTVSSDTQYAIVVIVVGGNGSWNWFDWWIQNAGGYRRGVYLDLNGDDWLMYSDKSHWFQVWGSDPTRQINLSSPTDTDTGIILTPLLAWTIAGDGATEGDLLDIFLKKDDADFGSDDQLGYLVDAVLNTNLQIVGGLEYNTTYYWQVQAAESTLDDLLSSTVYSFTTTTFRPPAVSIGDGGAGDFTGENNMLTVNRLISAAYNKIWYEDL